MDDLTFSGSLNKLMVKNVFEICSLTYYTQSKDGTWHRVGAQ